MHGQMKGGCEFTLSTAFVSFCSSAHLSIRKPNSSKFNPLYRLINFDNVGVIFDKPLSPKSVYRL